MNIVYQDDWITLINDDSRLILPQLEAADLILTDPPYGIGESSDRNRTRGHLAATKNYGDYHWDKKLDKPMIDLLRTKGTDQVIWGGNYYADWLPASSCWLVWDKDNSGTWADCELAWTSFKTAVQIFRWRWNGMLQQDMKHKEFRIHPIQKPAALMSWVIANYTKPGGLIYDPFLGSGTTAICAKVLGRRCVGIEIDPIMCKKAAVRCAQGVLEFKEENECQTDLSPTGMKSSTKQIILM